MRGKCLKIFSMSGSGAKERLCNVIDSLSHSTACIFFIILVRPNADLFAIIASFLLSNEFSCVCLNSCPL